MAGYDGTGPRGMGQQTGWGRGNCATDKRDSDRRGSGRFGRGRGGAPWGGGRGGGRRRRMRGQEWTEEPVSNSAQEIASLDALASSLEQRLQQVQVRLTELKDKQSTDDKQ